MTLRLIGTLAILVQGAVLVGCSDPVDEEEGTGGTSGTGGTPTGGTAGTSGTGGATGGTGGAAGSGGTGGSAGGTCTGVRSNMPCPTVGQVCENLVCGLADSGGRSCTCNDNGTGMGTWSCMACDFTNAPAWIQTPPDPMPMCPADAADEAPCAAVETICGPIGSEVCACWNSPNDGVSWDCDSPPSIWP